MLARILSVIRARPKVVIIRIVRYIILFKVLQSAFISRSRDQLLRVTQVGIDNGYHHFLEGVKALVKVQEQNVSEKLDEPDVY